MTRAKGSNYLPLLIPKLLAIVGKNKMSEDLPQPAINRSLLYPVSKIRTPPLSLLFESHLHSKSFGNAPMLDF